MSVRVLTLSFTRAMLSAAISYGTQSRNRSLRYLGYHSGVSKDPGYWDEGLSWVTPRPAAQHHIPEGLDPRIVRCEAKCDKLPAWKER